MNARAIVVDIEGTTGSIAFVRNVLFPYARKNLAGFVAARRDDEAVRTLLREAGELNGTPQLDETATVALLEEWIDRDRKAPPLKALQGMMWAQGYADGVFRGHVYGDAAAALRAWHAGGIALYVYSSGSIAAQQLLFRYSTAGDLTTLFSGYFDLTTGSKLAPSSYARIASEIATEPRHIAFFSDSVGELDAAGETGLQTICIQRDSGPPVTARHVVARTFDSFMAIGRA